MVSDAAWTAPGQFYQTQLYIPVVGGGVVPIDPSSDWLLAQTSKKMCVEQDTDGICWVRGIKTGV